MAFAQPDTCIISSFLAKCQLFYCIKLNIISHHYEKKQIQNYKYIKNKNKNQRLTLGGFFAKWKATCPRTQTLTHIDIEETEKSKNRERRSSLELDIAGERLAKPPIGRHDVESSPDLSVGCLDAE